jgi:hypothetical protein
LLASLVQKNIQGLNLAIGDDRNVLSGHGRRVGGRAKLPIQASDCVVGINRLG